MSHDYSAMKNKHPKEHYKQYLYNSNEPRDNISNDTPSEMEAELLGNSHFMRQQFRQVAQDIRDHYA
jgi:hypothetical protein